MHYLGKYHITTNDVETTSILNNCLSDETGEIVYKEGMPLLLDLYAEYGIKTTFFFTGYIAEKYPDMVKNVMPYGHEVASHGYTHAADMAFDLLSFEQQKEQLKKSKAILEQITGQAVISFRAPAARVNKDTALALAETGFKIDSSIASQRFDMFLSFGSRNKLKWLMTPRKPYFTDRDSLWKKGNGEILEIPISALLMPYIGTTMRMFPMVTSQLRKALAVESAITQKPVVFLTHPNEFIEENSSSIAVHRRSANFIGYLLGDVIRRKLKLKNLGKKALPIYRKEIEYFLNKGFRFVTCKEYYRLLDNRDNA